MGLTKRRAAAAGGLRQLSRRKAFAPQALLEDRERARDTRLQRARLVVLEERCDLLERAALVAQEHRRAHRGRKQIETLGERLIARALRQALVGRWRRIGALGRRVLRCWRLALDLLQRVEAAVVRDGQEPGRHRRASL